MGNRGRWEKKGKGDEGMIYHNLLYLLLLDPLTKELEIYDPAKPEGPQS